MASVDYNKSLPSWGKSFIKVEGIDEIAKTQLHEVPERYIRSGEERPSPPGTSVCDDEGNIPVIDMAKIAHPQHRQQEIGRIAKACQEWGFFQVINHGIPHSLMDKIKRVGRDFFELPKEEKERYGVRSSDLQGYGQTFVVSQSQKLDWGNILGLIIFPTELKDLSMWPAIADFRESVNAYNAEMRRLAETLLALIAETLQLPSDFFDKRFGNAYQKMRMNYYPPCPRPDLVLGLSAHADMTGLALLLQDDEVAGLQIHKDDQWMTVQPIPYALVINLGNLIEVMTNGRYKSIEHRAVTNKDKERLSIGVFYAPGFNEEIAPATQLIDENHPCLFRKFIHQDYIQNYFSRGVEGKNSLYEYAGINN